MVTLSVHGAIKLTPAIAMAINCTTPSVRKNTNSVDTLWPAHLWAIYASPRSLPAWQVLMAAAGIAAVSAVVLRQMRQRPWLAVGWLWFAGTLLPVIGLVQVGAQSRADRYMYVPMVGLAIMLAWGGAEVVARWPQLRRFAVALATAACLAMAIRTSAQTAYWSDSRVLLQHAIEMDSQNYLAWSFLGQIARNPVDAIECYRTGLRLRPEDAGLHYLLAKVLVGQDRTEEGVAEYRDAIWLNPASAAMHDGLGNALAAMDRQHEAIGEFERAVQLEPQFATAESDLGAMLWNVAGRAAEGLRHLERAVAINPGDARTQLNLGQALLSTPNRLEDAAQHLNEALQLDPGLADAHRGLMAYYRQVGKELEALAHLQAAQQLEAKAGSR